MSWKDIIKDVRWNMTKLERFKRLLMERYGKISDRLIESISDGKLRTEDDLDALNEHELFKVIMNEYYADLIGDDIEVIRYKEKLDELAGEFRH